MVPEAGLEPARYCYREILSLLCLPIPPPGHIGGIFRVGDGHQLAALLNTIRCYSDYSS